jgi:hypothetical protein
VPDLIICLGNPYTSGIFIAIELKTAVGKVSPIQDYTMRQIREAGGRTAVCRSAGEVKTFIEEVLAGKTRQEAFVYKMRKADKIY